MIDTDMALTYLEFVEERHRIWERRQAGEPQPWTEHPMLAAHKFTNVFRILDHDSQYLVQELLDPELSPRDALMRCFLFRHTGRVAAWDHLDLVGPGYPVVENLDDVLASWQEYRGKFREITSGTTTVGGGSRKGRISERPLFTSAYLVFPQSATPGTDKLESIIRLTQRLFDPSSPTDVVPDFFAASTQQERFKVLRRNKGVADFMSMQVLTDWGYSPQCSEDREDEFVVPGPGAKRGATALAPGWTADRVIRWAQEAVHASPDCPKLGDRLPSAMDIQNTLCEFGKLVRFMGRPTPRKAYRSAHPGPQPSPVLPEHWN